MSKPAQFVPKRRSDSARSPLLDPDGTPRRSATLTCVGPSPRTDRRTMGSFSNLRAFQLRREVFREPEEKALKTILETAL
ncbi:hypothetical protein [Halocatena pleomorpha]|uniref:Uncharacterized protein n=1 Tax=Halocatena pleomorpha TaxID=1785090 RepID=A0A3P3RAY7_9EURY|nr:hypothetical protein [Halocatena pleomorpha]RRJ30647.1 hypothetical protein EIK79_09200 [Halocatena pleomorpha]